MENKNTLLLLSCCAPCSGGVLARLAAENRPVALLFYNPNIYPAEEYKKRRDEQKRACEHFHIPFIELPYEPQAWLEAVKGLEREPERGARCSACFLFRLTRAAEYAREHGYRALSSVLGVSRYKDLDQVNEAARRAWYAVGKPYAAINWRKNGLEELRQALIKELQLYKQDYCGCKYSMRGKNDK